MYARDSWRSDGGLPIEDPASAGKSRMGNSRLYANR